MFYYYYSDFILFLMHLIGHGLIIHDFITVLNYFKYFIIIFKWANYILVHFLMRFIGLKLISTILILLLMKLIWPRLTFLSF